MVVMVLLFHSNNAHNLFTIYMLLNFHSKTLTTCRAGKYIERISFPTSIFIKLNKGIEVY